MRVMNLKNIMQKIGICIFMGLIFALSITLLAPNEAFAASMPYSVEIPKDAFPVRAEPLPDAAVVATLNSGSLLFPESISGDWYKVPFENGIYGYVHKGYVTAKLTTTMVSIFPGVALRSGAGESYSTISVCSKNTEFTVSEVENGWCKGILYGTSTVGYIASSNLSCASKVLYKTTPVNPQPPINPDGKTVVIDPGHGSNKTYTSPFDSGAIGPSGLKEKDPALKIGLKIEYYLKAEGINVIMTRRSDVGVLTLVERAEIANAANADLFISVHCNSSTTSSAHGTETYYSNVDEFKVAINPTLEAERKKLASSVQKKLVQQLGLTNRGVKTSNFTVITKSKMPAILIETAFISNPTEERLLKTDAFLDKAARGASAGITEFLK